MSIGVLADHAASQLIRQGKPLVLPNYAMEEYPSRYTSRDKTSIASCARIHQRFFPFGKRLHNPIPPPPPSRRNIATMASQESTQQNGGQDHNGGDTVHCNDLKWLPLAPKVWIKLVKLVSETGGYTVIVRAEKGGVLPRHRHVDSAEIYVIRGDGRHPQTGHFSQGDYVSERKGAVHDPLVFEEEVEMLMISSGPSMFIDDEGNDLFSMDIPMLQGLAASVA